MNRRRLTTLFTTACAFTLLLNLNIYAATTEKKPNILFAFADDWGWPHAGVYGDQTVQTPAFDRLAKEGVLFTQAFISSPSCTPSRGAVLTGQHFWRLDEGANLWSSLDKEIPVYTELLADAGYFVGYTRKGWGPGRIADGGRDQNPAGPRFNSFEQFLKDRPDGQPFCFWFGSHDPHRGYNPKLKQQMGINPDSVIVPPYFPDSPAVREDIADYYAEVQRFDNDVARLLTALEEIDELDNTLVVVSGDHGMPFPRCKTQLYDSGARVPLAIRWPQNIPGDRVVNDLVSLTDLAPTFLEAAGMEPLEIMTGQSLLGILTSNKEGVVDESRKYVFFGRERHTVSQEDPISGGYPMRAVRSRDFLYIRNFIPQRWPSGTPDFKKAYKDNAWLSDCDNGPTKFFMWAHRLDPKIKPLYALAFSKRPGEELYDLKHDPYQTNNVAADPDYAEIKSNLKDVLTTELRRTDDPRIQGKGDKLEQYPYYGGAPAWPGQDVIDQYK
ncbi:MAG: sulfatase [Verrucomicrobia bacterium]|nr:sulfatase [Verrucomicrobiota bacterium]